MIAVSSCCPAVVLFAARWLTSHQIWQGNERFMQKCCLSTSLWRLGTGLGDRTSSWDEGKLEGELPCSAACPELAGVCAAQTRWLASTRSFGTTCCSTEW